MHCVILAKQDVWNHEIRDALLQPRSQERQNKIFREDKSKFNNLKEE